MSFKDQLAADAAAVFCNADEFGESVTYLKADGTSRSITALVIRNIPQVDEMGVLRYAIEAHVPNDATTGILDTEADFGGDQLRIAEREGGTDTVDLHIHKSSSGEWHDAGMLHLELQ